MEVDRITAAVVARAKPDPARDVWIVDRSLSGFCVRVYPSGRKAYILTYQRGRSRPKVVIGEHGAPWKHDPSTGAPRVLTPELAREEAIRLLGGLVEGRDPAALRGVATAIPTLAQFAPRYFRDHADAHKAPRAAAGDRGNLKRHLLPPLGSIRMDRITTGDVARVHASMSGTAVTANRCIALLSHIFTKARQWGVLPPGHVNPCTDIERFPEPKSERFLLPDELPRVGVALENEPVYQRAGLLLVMLTGARPGEILALKREWVNCAAGMGVLQKSKTSKRTGKPRIVVFNEAALAVYDATPPLRGNPYLIPSPKIPGAPMSIFTLEAAWERVRAAAGVEDVRLMALRHTFASVGVGSSETLMMIGTLLGHSNPQTTMRYAHLAADPLRAASDRVAAIINDALKPKVPATVSGDASSARPSGRPRPRRRRP